MKGKHVNMNRPRLAGAARPPMLAERQRAGFPAPWWNDRGSAWLVAAMVVLWIYVCVLLRLLIGD